MANSSRTIRLQSFRIYYITPLVFRYLSRHVTCCHLKQKVDAPPFSTIIGRYCWQRGREILGRAEVVARKSKFYPCPQRPCTPAGGTSYVFINVTASIKVMSEKVVVYPNCISSASCRIHMMYCTFCICFVFLFFVQRHNVLFGCISV